MMNIAVENGLGNPISNPAPIVCISQSTKLLGKVYTLLSPFKLWAYSWAEWAL